MTAPVVLTGDTYPVRGQLSALGAWWVRPDKVWKISAERAAEAQAIIDAQPAWVCDECGAELRRPFCPSCRDEMFIRQIRGEPVG